MKLSIVTTLFRSAAFVEEFHRRITAAAAAITEDFEIIMVDDGSPDDSLAIARRIVDRDPRLRVVELSRNFGHHAAMMTGLDLAAGDLVFLIDSDLEEPPELLSQFHETLKKADGKLDVVYGCQEERQGSFLKKYGGSVSWRLIDFFLPFHVPQNHSTVRLMTRDYTRALVAHRERKTAIGGLWVLTGFKQQAFLFQKGARKVSSYSFGRRFGMLLESVTSFSEVPLLFILYLGLFMFASSTLFVALLIARRLLGTVGDGWTSVMVSIWFFGGLTILSIGIVGLYIARIFLETKNRPYTIVRKIYETRTPAPDKVATHEAEDSR
jgi:putative glycosyltransferase